MPYLKVSTPAKGVQWIPLAKDVVVIGRSQECDVPLEDTVASRKHCRLRRVQGGYVLEDLQSKNGTFVNGAPVGSCPLKDGDLIAVGEQNLTFKLEK